MYVNVTLNVTTVVVYVISSANINENLANSVYNFVNYLSKLDFHCVGK